MPPTRKAKAQKKDPGPDSPRLDALPRNAGYLLSIGPVILWLDPATAEQIRALLDHALARAGRRASPGDAN